MHAYIVYQLLSHPDPPRLATRFDSTQFTPASVQGVVSKGKEQVDSRLYCEAPGDSRAKSDTDAKPEHRGRESRSGFCG